MPHWMQAIATGQAQQPDNKLLLQEIEINGYHVRKRQWSPRRWKPWTGHCDILIPDNYSLHETRLRLSCHELEDDQGA